MPIYGTNGRDTLLGNNGNNTIYGLNGNDILSGGNGNDRLGGGGGDDILFGGRGNDYMHGASGDDNIYGVHGGLDRMRGGAGQDGFYLGKSNQDGVANYYQGDGYAVIEDYTHFEDAIFVLGSTFNYNFTFTVFEGQNSTEIWLENDLIAITKGAIVNNSDLTSI